LILRAFAMTATPLPAGSPAVKFSDTAALFRRGVRFEAVAGRQLLADNTVGKRSSIYNSGDGGRCNPASFLG
jgi:hypothetical protein